MFNNIFVALLMSDIANLKQLSTRDTICVLRPWLVIPKLPARSISSRFGQLSPILARRSSSQMFGIFKIRSCGNRPKHPARTNFSEKGIGWNLNRFQKIISNELMVMSIWKISTFVCFGFTIIVNHCYNEQLLEFVIAEFDCIKKIAFI